MVLKSRNSKQRKWAPSLVDLQIRCASEIKDKQIVQQANLRADSPCVFLSTYNAAPH